MPAMNAVEIADDDDSPCHLRALVGDAATRSNGRSVALGCRSPVSHVPQQGPEPSTRAPRRGGTWPVVLYVGAAIFFTADLARRLGKRRQRIAVAGLNPHAGEQGLLGSEETATIAPGIALGRKRIVRARLGASVEGPIGAETAIRKAYAGSYDAVVAMYHDQATIPMKLVAFGDAVNVTMGLSIVRTSVDHGTAYDIAWSGQADAAGMSAALELALKLV